MADPKASPKMVMVNGVGVVQFPASMDDEHVARAIKSFSAKKNPSLTTEESEHSRQLKPAKPLDTAIPTLPDWAKTPLPDLAEKGNRAFNRSLGLPEVSPMEQQIREAGKQFDTQHPIAGGVMQGVSNFGKGMLTPANIGLMLTAPQSKLLSAYFATQAMKGSYASAKEAEKAFHGGRNYDAARYATESLLGLGVAGMAGKHAVEGTAVDTSTLKEPTGPKTIEGEGKATTYVPPYLRPASEIVPVEATANISRRGVPAAPKPVAKPLSMEQVKAQAEALKAQKPAVVPVVPIAAGLSEDEQRLWQRFKVAYPNANQTELVGIAEAAQRASGEPKRNLHHLAEALQYGGVEGLNKTIEQGKNSQPDKYGRNWDKNVGERAAQVLAEYQKAKGPQATPVVPVVAPNATPAVPVQKQPVPVAPTQAVQTSAQVTSPDVKRPSYAEPDLTTAEVVFSAHPHPTNLYRGTNGEQELQDILSSKAIKSTTETATRLDKPQHAGMTFFSDHPNVATSYVHDGGYVLEVDKSKVPEASGHGAGEIATSQPTPLEAVKRIFKVGKDATGYHSTDVTSQFLPAKGTPAVAPVEPTANLTKQTETPEFKNWFGDWQDPHAWSSKRDPNKPAVSMAVKNGKPMVLYHATAGDFDQFEVGRKSYNSNVFGPYETNRHGIFLAEDPSFAGEFVIDPESPNSKPKKGGKTLPVYVNIKSPLDLREGKSTLDQETLDEFKEHGVNPRWILNGTQHTWELFDDEDGKEFVRAAQEIGYDGAIITDDSQGDAKNTDTWVAFKPEQIKSAIGNKGTFNPLSGDITANLTQQTQTPQFKQWFGDSKVVDETGNPRVLIHSTNSDWNVFDPNKAKRGSFGFHAGTAEQADKVRDTGGTSGDVTAQRPLDGMNMMPVYLKISNPLRMTDKGTWYPWELIDRLDKEHNVNVKAEPPTFDEGMRIMDYAPHMSINWERRSPARQVFDIAAKQHMVEWRKNNPHAGREQYEDEQHRFEKDYVIKVMEDAGYDGIVYDNKYEKGGDSYMVFHPEQIKSAIGNSGAFDPKKLDITANLTYKAADQSQPFYLKSESIVADKMRGPMPADDLHKMLLSNGVKPEEMKWTGLDELLQGKGKEKVTPQEIQDFVRTHDLQIEEVAKGVPSDMAAEIKRIRESDYNGMPWNQLSRLEQQRIVAKAEKESPSLPTKFSGYVLPGGNEGSYRELLVTMPSRSTPMEYPEPLTALPDGYEVTRDSQRVGDQYAIIPPGQVHGRPFDNRYYATPEKAQDAALQLLNQRRNTAAADEWRSKNEGNSFRSNHWDEPNVLGHIRFNDRTGPNGEKILHIEELQSDLHQGARTQGYRLSSRETAPMDSEYRALVHKNADARTRGEEPKPEDVARAKELEDALIKADKSKIPDMPFKKNWHELMLKRMLKYAAEHGYDGVSWTPGDQQAERYDLSKKISEIHYSGTNLKAYDHDGNTVINRTGVNSQELPDIIGKEAAQKLMDQEPKGTLRSLVGQDLKVGGEGMKGFYDKIIPDAANKLGKQWGAKVGETKIDVSKPDSWKWDKNTATVKHRGAGYEVWAKGLTGEGSDTNKFRNAFDTEEEARKYIENYNPNNQGSGKTVPYLPITPEMRASGPMPLFNLVYKSESAPKEELDKVWSELESLKDKRDDARQAGDEDKEAVYDRKAKDLAKQWMDLAHKDIGQIRDLYDGSRVLYLTRSGLNALTRGVYGRLPSDLSMNGVSLSPEQVDKVIENLSILKPTAAEELKTLLEKAKDKNGNVAVSAIPYKGESVNEALSRLREELNHGWQKVFGDAVGNHLAPEQFDELNLAIPQGMKDHLAQNYPGLANSESPKISRMRVLEASAHMLSGSPSELGMTEEEVAPYLFQYFQAVEKQHGEKALDELVHITTKARQIKEDYFNATGRDKGSKSGQGNVPSVQEQGAGGDQGSSAEAGRGVPPRSDGEGGTEGINNAKGSGASSSGAQGTSGVASIPDMSRSQVSVARQASSTPPTLAQVKEWAAMLNTNNVRVKTPDGMVHIFPDEKSAAAFRSAAGLE